MKKIFIATIFVFIIFFLVLFWRLSRPSTVVQNLGQIYVVKLNVESALRLGLFTRNSVAAETGCENGCGGGIIQGYDLDEIRKFCPELLDYSPDKSAVLWTYNFKPNNATRKNQLFGNELVITGNVENTHRYYMTLLNWQIANPTCIIVYRDEKGNYL